MRLTSTLWTFLLCRAISHLHHPTVSMHLSSFAVPIVAQIIVAFYHATGPWWQDFCHRVSKLIICPTHLRNSMNDTLIHLGNTRKMSVKCLLILSVKWFTFLRIYHFRIDKIIAKMVGVTHKVYHAYSIWSTWFLHHLAAKVPFTACVINLLSLFVYNLDLSNFS